MKSDKQEHWSQVVRIAKPHKWSLGSIALASFIGGLVEAAFLVVVTQTGLALAQGDELLTLAGGVEVTPLQAVGLALALVVVRGVLSIVRVVIEARLAYNVSVRYRTLLSDSFLATSWATQQAEPTGRLQQLVGSFADNTVRMLNNLTTAITTTLSLIALLIVAVIVSPLATVLVFLLLVALGLLLSPVRRAIRRRANESADNWLTSSAKISELGALGLEMQTFGVRREFTETLRASIESLAHVERREKLLRDSVAPLYTSLAYIAIILGLGAATTVDTASIADIGAVMLVMLRSLGYGSNAQSAIANVVAAAPFTDVLEATITRYQENHVRNGATAVTDIGTIEASDLSFEYVADTPALRNFNFTIAAGEHVGIVGPSGSGKSTLVQLLLGLRSPTAGELRVGGVHLRDVDRDTLAPLVAFVAQEPNVFSGTIAENIAFFRAVDRTDIEAAAQQARLAPDLAAMPDGLDTEVGERGSQLSGGQRQRIAIARALAGRPKLLILDEPTSALDALSESAIRATLAEMRGTVTVVVIAHRLSTLDHCDRVMVIEDGHLLDFDEPGRLARDNRYFREALAISQNS